MTQKDLFYVVGLICSLAVALAGVADQLPEAWRTSLTVAGVLSTAVNGVLLRSPHQE